MSTAAEKLKQLGNEAFKTFHFAEAVEKYTEALEVATDDENTLKVILFSNRELNLSVFMLLNAVLKLTLSLGAFANLKSENYGLALVSVSSKQCVSHVNANHVSV